MATTAVQPVQHAIPSLWRLVWPVLIEQVLAMLVGWSEIVLAGHYLHEEHLVAIGFISYAIWALSSLFSVIAVGATAMTARFVGAGDVAQANRVTNQAFLAGGVLAVVMTVLGLLFGGQLVAVMQLHDEPARLATRFLHFLLPILPAMMLQAVGIACLRGAGDMLTGMMTMTMVNVVNIVVSWTLLLASGSDMSAGWDGMAIGTTCGEGAGGLIVLLLLLRGRAGLRLKRRLLRFDRDLIRRLLRIGLPGGADIMSIIVCQLSFLAIINTLGVVAAAAHNVAIRVESLAFLPGGAFQIAAATLAGQHLGARDQRQASYSVLHACLQGCLLMLAGGVALYLGADRFVYFFLGPDKPEVAELAAQLVRLVSFGMLPLGPLMILSGALRGAGDTRWPLACTFIGFLCVRLPGAYLLGRHWHLGVRGAWYAMIVDLVVRCGLVVYRFWQGGWKRVEV